MLHLSDAFENQSLSADVDLRVRVLNINRSHNRELMEKCRVLREYAEFVAVTKAYAAKATDRKAALSRAIDDCIEQNILAEFLRTYRAEVLGMLLEEFDVKKYERTIRAEGRFEHMIILISKKKSKGCTAEEIADILEEDIELVNKIYTALEKYDAEKEWEEIIRLL